MQPFFSDISLVVRPPKLSWDVQIMELAGHTDLKTTQRYMHLSPAMKDSAIRLLEQPIPEGAAA